MIEQEYNTACSLIEAGDLQQASEKLESILAEDNQYYPALNKLGVVYSEQQKHDEAKMHFHRVLEINPEYAPAFVNLGNLHMEAKDYQKAIECYRTALEKDSDYCYAYYNLAIAYKRLGDFGKYIHNIKEYKRLYAKGFKGKVRLFGPFSRRYDKTLR